MGALPDGYQVRSLTEDDFEAATEILRAEEAAQYGHPDTSLDDIEGWLATVDLANDAWLVSQVAGGAAALAWLHRRRPTQTLSFGCVHPAHEGRGLGSFLLATIEAHARKDLARVQPELGVTLGAGTLAPNEGARRLVEQAGFHWVRRFWDMHVDLERGLLGPTWPTGIEVSTLAPGQERAVFDAVQEAFEDHWNHARQPFEEWEKRTTKLKSFDPELWFVASEGDEIAGLSLCRQRVEGGWVDVLAVRRPWRRRGLGEALLRHSFAEFFQRGTEKVGLGVDSENLTGATKLYERVGMRVTREFDAYEKELRGGVPEPG